MDSDTKNAIYYGDVFHERHMPFTHKLRYRVFSLYMDIDQLARLDENLKYFGFNRWNILSVWNKDHAARDGSDIRPWIEKAARKKGIDLTGGKIYMLCFPRLWGYVFNPLTIYFCYERRGKPACILYQVKNTFGEQHGYLLPIEKIDQEGGRISHACQKEFHVSPFIEMNCEYRFRLYEPDDILNVGIHQYTKDGKILTAIWNGKRADLTDKLILRYVLRHPLMTLKVIAGIHWEAFHLWRKGAKYYKKPPPPLQDVS